ncbi:hypothetical protein JHN63_43190 [Streptomyces sp. MBT65]|uniref:hypothetical protein n=1 Tax=Streptomyces sp. MBT65 TaxID=1488395 RepID=UPI00190B2349|nr:hypothetical protein [Streptomyces sp. MBT65]MBK3580478.1 hypothetical protein [Streptomyces sp. MBT65]
MPALNNHHDMQHTSHDDALYEALVLERYGRSLQEILWEETKRPLPELLKERHRRPALAATPAVRRQPRPDPDAAAHLAALLEADVPRRRRAA